MEEFICQNLFISTCKTGFNNLDIFGCKHFYHEHVFKLSIQDLVYQLKFVYSYQHLATSERINLFVTSLCKADIKKLKKQNYLYIQCVLYIFVRYFLGMLTQMRNANIKYSYRGYIRRYRSTLVHNR